VQRLQLKAGPFLRKGTDESGHDTFGTRLTVAQRRMGFAGKKTKKTRLRCLRGSGIEEKRR